MISASLPYDVILPVEGVIITPMKGSIRLRVRNTRLPKTKPLMPLFETVMNAFQSINQAGNSGHRIAIRVVRQSDLYGVNKLNPIAEFAVSDTGVGFTDANYDSFDTIDSAYKIDQGGKGLGRFTWLVAFDRVEIDSEYRHAEGQLKRRVFSFVQGTDSLDPPGGTISDSNSNEPRTTVRLVGYQSPYRDYCPRGLDVIAQNIVGHFLQIFLDAKGPEISISDEFDTIDLRQFYRAHFESGATQYAFSVGPRMFKLRGFRLRGSMTDRHELIFAADSREVITEKLSGALASLPPKLEDSKGNKFTYLGFVESTFLNEQVTSDRTGFKFPDESPDPNEVSLKGIRDAASAMVREDLEPYLKEVNQAKRDAVTQFVAQDAPHYRWLAKHIETFIDEIPAEPSKTDLETVLHREQHKREVKLKEESDRILKQNVTDLEAYYAELEKFAQEYNEMGMSALAQHILHRRVILELLERAVAQQADGTYGYERVIHNLIFPMKRTSDDIPPDRQNLWIIDETLSYHSYLTSDIAFKDMHYLESPSGDRPDIAIFDHALAFTDGTQPLTAMQIVEFKRPDRDDYKEGPLEQINRLVDDIRSGNWKDKKGLQILPANERIPAYCYILCDLTPKLKGQVLNAGMTATPDGQGYFFYNAPKTMWIEVISYRKLLEDATKRNRALFEKLGLSS
jgi:hypothetical protein